MNTVAANRTYVNARVNHSVVVVERESFGTGRHTLVQIKENPFIEVTLRPEGAITIAPPLIKPRNPIFIVPPEIRDHVHSLPPRMAEHERMAREVSETRHGARPSAQHVLPPERFRNIRPEEMKNERRVVKEREASVFRPQPPENLTVRKMKEPKMIIRKPGQKARRNSQGEGGEKHQDRQQNR